MRALGPLAVTAALALSPSFARAEEAPRVPSPEDPATKTEAPAPPTSPPTRVDGPVDPARPPSPVPPAHPEVPEPGRFEFGSYGRVRFGSDLRGGTGRSANVVSHGTRIDEESYAELELRREDTFRDDIKTKVVTTLAVFPPFFHFSGNPTQQIALRNLYAQASYGGYTLWAGSRMYRGDDIYLLDWWPLDNQNTLGGGFGARLPPALGETTVAAHVGMQRLDNPYQFQQIAAQAPFGFGAISVTKLDRPRTVETLKITHLLRNSATRRLFDGDKKGFKVDAGRLERYRSLYRSFPGECEPSDRADVSDESHER